MNSVLVICEQLIRGKKVNLNIHFGEQSLDFSHRWLSQKIILLTVPIVHVPSSRLSAVRVNVPSTWVACGLGKELVFGRASWRSFLPCVVEHCSRNPVACTWNLLDKSERGINSNSCHSAPQGHPVWCSSSAFGRWHNYNHYVKHTEGLLNGCTV